MMSFPYEVQQEHNEAERMRLQKRSITVFKVFAYFAGPFAGFIVELPGSHHHGLVHHITSLLLGELLIFFLWRWRPGGRNLTLRKGRFWWCCLIIKLQGQVKVIMDKQFQMTFLIQGYAYLRTYVKLIQFRRRWWWEVWLLGLEGLPYLCHSTEDLIT